MKSIKFTRIILRYIGYLALGSMLITGCTRVFTEVFARPRIYTIKNAPKKRAAVVFGAGLRRDGTPTPVLQDRIAVAAQLYFDGKVKKILVSGDNRFIDYNEPGAMYNYAIKLGVPAEDIIRDYAGRRTYDTCYRAKFIFQLDDVLLVTQDFHLPRTLFLCNALGLKGEGVQADLRTYTLSSYLFWHLREMLATPVAFLDALVFRPEPVLGQAEPIFED
jgi:SanA protein